MDNPYNIVPTPLHPPLGATPLAQQPAPIEQLTTTIWDMVQALIVVMDPQGRILEFNRVCEETTGYSLQEVQGKCVWDFLLIPEEIEAVRGVFAALQGGQFPSHHENSWVTKTGDRRIIAWANTVMLGEGGAIELIVATGTDITEQRQMTLALQESERQREHRRNDAAQRWSERALQSLVVGTAAVTGEDFFPTLVEQTARALEVPHVVVTELVGDRLTTLAFWSNGQLQPNITYPYQDTPCELSLQQGIYACPISVQDIFPKDRDLHHLQVESYLGVAMKNRLGQPIGNLCLLDVKPLANLERMETLLRIFAARAGAELERQRATRALEKLNQELEDRIAQRTQELQASEERWQLALKGANDGMWDWDLRTQKIFFSGRWKEMRGFSHDEIGDTPAECLDRIHPDDYDRVMAAVDEHFAGKTEFFKIEYRVRRKDDTYMWVLDRAQAFRDASGTLVRMIGSDTDISEQKQAEADRDRLLSFLDASLSEVYVFDATSLRFVYANRGAIRNVGYDLEALKTLTPLNLKPDFTATEFEQLLCPLLEKRQSLLKFETRHRRADGSFYPVEVHLQQHEYLGENFFLAVILDISDRKRVERALQESQTLLRLVMDSLPQAIFWKDRHGRYLGCNRQLLMDAGLSSVEDIIGKTDDDLPWRTEAPLYQQDDRQVITTGQPKLNIEEPITKVGNSQRWLRTNKIPLLDVDNQIIGVLGTYEDITSQKQTDQALRESRQRYATLATAAPVGIFRTNASGHCLYVNDRWCQITGLSREESLGFGWTQSLHPLDRDSVIQEWYDTAQTHQMFRMEYRFQRSDGQVTWVFGQAVPEKDETEAVIGYIGTITDITDRKQIEAQLRQSNEQLAMANLELSRATRLKDEFLANMSHELRTPLSSILGLSQTLQRDIYGVLSDRQRKAITTIEQSGRHLLALINDILDLAKIESGKLELHRTTVFVEEMCSDSLLFVKQQAFQKHIHLAADIAEEIETIEADELRLKQALINLLGNAVKFTPPGGHIVLRAWIDWGQQPTDIPALVLCVVDTGIGIKSEDIEHLFQSFVQLDSSLSRQHQGTGLGLALVKRIVEMHGGTVGVESEVGRGSQFWMRLPYRESPRSPSASVDGEPEVGAGGRSLPPATPATPPQILLAEDNEANLDMLVDALQSVGYRVAIARNGFEVLQTLQGQPPDLILMDIQMPGIDGLETIRRIRVNPAFSHLPIVALTALAMPGDRERCLAAGADDYLAKPIQLGDLITTLQRLL